MSVIRTSVSQPVTVTVGVILTVLAGLIAVQRIPIQLTPNVEDTIIAVTTRWEGASPQEVEQDVIDEQEQKLQGISNLRSMTSVSQQGQGVIRLEFATGTSKDVALREVSDKLREVPDYPADVDEPVIDASDPESQDYIAWVLLGTDDPDLDIRTVQDFAEDRIKPALERVDGVSEVNVLGGRERELQVVFDPLRLAQRGLSPADMLAALRSTNRNVSAGELEQRKSDVRVRLVSQYTRIVDIENTVLKETPGGPVLVRDVAEVRNTYKEAKSFVHNKGRPAIAINAQKEVGANVMEVMAGLQAEFDRLNAPGGVLDTEARRLGLQGTLHLFQVYDQTVYIDDALALVKDNIWLGGSIAILVLLLFLRSLRSSLIIALAIPISVVGAIAVMVALGRTINVISLAGMAFAVGMVVDNAIVVLENVFRHLEMGKTRRQAALDGTQEVYGAVIAATLTTLVVFLPILMIEEEAGQLFRDIALAIVAAVSLSLIVSITVIPCAAARLLPRQHEGQRERPPATGLRRLTRMVTGLPEALAAALLRLNRGIVGRVAVIALLTGASIVGTVLLLPPLDYLPTGNRNLVFGMLITPPGYSLEQQHTLAARMEGEMAPFFGDGNRADGSAEASVSAASAPLPEIPTFDMAKGVPGPPVVPPLLDNYFVVGRSGMMFHGAIAEDATRIADVLPLFRYATRPELAPGVLAFAFQMPLFRLGGRSGSAVKVNFSGDDLDAVVRSALAVYVDLIGRYGVFSIQPDPSNFNIPSPELQVQPDLVRLGEVGLSAAELGAAVQAFGDGALAGDYRIGGQTIDLKLLSSQSTRADVLDSLGDAPIATPRGGVVPLSSLATLRRVNAAPQINRNSRQRSVTLQVSPPAGVALGQVMGEIQTVLQQFRDDQRIPSSVSTSTTGSASKLDAVRRAMLGDGTLVGTLTSSLLLALLVVYLLMCVLFQSFLQPLVIMFSVPLATLGGFAALWLVHTWSTDDPYMPVQNLDILTMLGFVILVGVVVNNAILIVHQSLNYMRGSADEGGRRMEASEAIAEAVRTRVRPILMSTATSLGGMLPLVLMPGSGSELYRGLGAVVVGGLTVSTVFTLVLVPLLLGLVMDLQKRAGLLQGMLDSRAASVAALLLAVGLGLSLPGCRSTPAPVAAPSLEVLLDQLVAEHDAALSQGAGDGAGAPGETRAAARGAADADAARATDDAAGVSGATRRTAAAQDTAVQGALAGRGAELEQLGGPTAWSGARPDLADDLLGRPRQVLPLALGQAIEKAAAGNLGIQLSRLQPEIDAEGLTIAEASFDTSLFSEATWNSSDQPQLVPVLNGVTLGRPDRRSITSNLRAGVRKKLDSGATLTLSTFLERFKDRTAGISYLPDPAYRSGVSLEANVPLLQGAGEDVALQDVALGRNQLQRSRELLRADLLSVVEQTEQAYWDLVAAWAGLRIQQHLTDQGAEVQRVLDERKVFDVQPAQASDALATLERRRADLLRERRAVESASDRLLALMNDPEHPLAAELLLEPQDTLSEAPLDYDLRRSLETALRERPEVAVALLGIDDDRLRQAVADDAVLPQLDLDARLDVAGLDDDPGSGYRASYDDRHHSYALGLSFEVPLGNRASEASLRRAQRRVQATLVQYRDVTQAVVLEVKDALRDVETSHALIAAARSTRLAESENLRSLLLLEQQRNELTPEFLNLKFQRQERLAQAQRDEQAALVDYNQAVARYYRTLGVGSRLGRIVLDAERAADAVR